MTPVALPTEPQVRKASPYDARVFIGGVPKVGKSTLASQWNPEETLFLDCEGGTRLLDGKHFVLHVNRYQDFVDAISLLKGEHPYKTVIVDTVDQLVKLADRHVADGRKTIAAGVVEFGKGLAELEGLVRRDVGALLSMNVGVWFLGHTELVGDDKASRMIPTVDRRVRPYIIGACDFILLAETIGSRRVLHTQPSERYEAGSRVPLPEPLDLDARKLYAAMHDGLSPVSEEVDGK
jgi:AAA domain